MVFLWQAMNDALQYTSNFDWLGSVLFIIGFAFLVFLIRGVSLVVKRIKKTLRK